ncbi:MAG: hypothetical protein MJA29_13535 [Candidatus Omnitrophica bacterium]|nr:hypothetical protein [Candidatus Omnitrophota bacterium]
MHESHLFRNLLSYLDTEQQTSSKKIRKIRVTLSEFGGITPGHFLGHFRDASHGTSWEKLDIEISRIPYGPEMEITKIYYAH